MRELSGSRRHPFRAGPLTNPEFFRIELTEFADMAYAFMTGIPGWGSSGFRMMGPDELKRQRWTYVKYWINKLNRDRDGVAAAFKQ